MKEITIKEAQTEVDHWIKTVGVKYFSELTNLGILMEEVGELSRHMVRIYGEQSYRKELETLPPAGEDLRGLLSDELADILWVVLCLANQTGVDLTDALQKNLEKKRDRDAQRHRQNEKLK